MKTWKHKQLGEFTYDEIGWMGKISLPSFEVFLYRCDEGSKPSGKFDLQFDHETDEGNSPSQGAIDVVRCVTKHQKKLVAKLKQSLFDDFHGKGPMSGMWWHGDAESIKKYFTKECKSEFSTPDDIEHLLGCFSVTVQESVYRYDHPCATLCFEAPFDLEHGVGILTDGIDVIGTGYQMSVSPFNDPRIRRSV